MQLATRQIVFLVSILSAANVQANEENLRSKKHFSLFSVVTFKNEQCQSEAGFTGGVTAGTCYTATECGDNGGTKSGNCASGFGVCCILISKTGVAATINKNRTHIRNVNYPNAETAIPAAVTYTIEKMQSDICQVRLDFDHFVIAGPTSTDENNPAATVNPTNCKDAMVTTLTNFGGVGSAAVPVLCGVMTGEHIYLDLGMESTDTAMLAFTFAIATTITAANAFRAYSIKTSQIPCWATYRAPEGCLRYFMQPVGQIISPNFSNDPAGTSRAANQLLSGTDLASQHIKSCIRREKGMCCVRYQVCNQFGGKDLGVTLDVSGAAVANCALNDISEGWSFHIKLSGAMPANTEGNCIDDESNIGVVDAGCTHDYVEIPDSTTGHKNFGAAVQVNSRYCGARLGFLPEDSEDGVLDTFMHAPIYACQEPWEVTYRTDQMNDDGIQAIAITDVDEDVMRGLCLDFEQEAC